MAQCKNCFSSVDGRSASACVTCTSPLHRECAIKEDGALFCDVCYTVKAETPIKVEYDIPEVIRRTYIELYKSCPHKFFKEVIEGNASPATCYTQVGIDLHELFEKALLDRSYTHENMKDDFYPIWTGYIDSLFDSEEQKLKMHKRAYDSMEEFYNIIDSIPTPFTTEETIRFNIGEDIPDVEFTMDLVTENESGNLELHDWKTGKVMTGQKISSDLQAPLYIYGVQKHFNRTIDRFTFYYLGEQKKRVFERVNDNEFVCVVRKREYKINLLDAVREVKSLFGQIKKGNFGIPTDTKKMFFTCKTCHLKEMELCRGAQEEIWYTK